MSHLERLTYRSSKHATRFAWRTVILSIVFGSAIFIILPLTAKKLEKKEKKLILTKAPNTVKIKVPEKEKIYEPKKTTKTTTEVETKQTPAPPSTPQPPAVPVNITVSPVKTDISLQIDTNLTTNLNFKVEKIQAIKQVAKKPIEVQEAPPVVAPPTTDYNAIFSQNEVDQDATVIRKGTVVFPRKALRRRIGGKVIIKCIISKQGKIVNPQIYLATPKGYFEEACLDALDKFLYKPAMINGKPVAQRMELTFDLMLKK